MTSRYFNRILRYISLQEGASLCNTFCMKRILHRTIFFLAILVVGCGDQFSLRRVESAAAALKKCEVNQTLPGECVEARKTVEELTMRAIQSGIDQQRIYVSVSLGERTVEGSPVNSPYQRVTRAFNASFSTTPIAHVYENYKTACEPKEPNKKSPAEAFFGQDFSIGKWFKYFGQVQHGDRKFFIFYKTDQPCRPENYLEIDDQFAVVGNGHMLAYFSTVGRKKLPHEDFVHEAIVVDSLDLAVAKLQELKMIKASH